MSAAYWREHSLNAIRKAISTIHEDSDEKTKRKAISAAYPFFERKYYPYKIWLAEVAKYFAPPKNRKTAPSDIRRIEQYEQATGKQFPGGSRG